MPVGRAASDALLGSMVGVCLLWGVPLMMNVMMMTMVPKLRMKVRLVQRTQAPVQV